MIIPFFSLKRQYENNKSLFQSAITDVLNSQLFIGGKHVKEFEDEMSAFLGCKYVKSCNSGTDALWLALKALDIQKNDIVLTTPFSFIASSSEIAAHEACPVFIDIEEDTFNISSLKLDLWLRTNAFIKDGKTIHIKTKQPITGIIAVNIFGQMAEHEELIKIAKKWNLWIIEDAAQSIGAHINNKKWFGTITTFSFYPTKNVGAFGDAGCLATDDPELASKIDRLKNHGRHSKYDYLEYGINSRMDSIQAAILKEKLKMTKQLNNQRRKNAEIYKQELKDISFIDLPQEIIGHHVYHQFSVMVEDHRNSFIDHLSDNNIGTAIFYPKPLYHIEYLKSGTDKSGTELVTKCPVTEKVTTSILSLPIWPELTPDEIKTVCNTIKTFNPKHITSKQEALSL